MFTFLLFVQISSSLALLCPLWPWVSVDLRQPMRTDQWLRGPMRDHVWMMASVYTQRYCAQTECAELSWETLELCLSSSENAGREQARDCWSRHWTGHSLQVSHTLGIHLQPPHPHMSSQIKHSTVSLEWCQLKIVASFFSSDKMESRVLATHVEFHSTLTQSQPTMISHTARKLYFSFNFFYIFSIVLNFKH